MKPICVKCQRFYRIKKGGISFIEAMPANGSHPKPGTSEPENWKPYKLWHADLWECQGCGHQQISGCGFEPISEHYKPEFAKQVQQWQPMVQVNDC